MDPIKFTVKEDRDTIATTFPCGVSVELLSANQHGTTWVLWSLVDQVDEHLDRCEGCKRTRTNLGVFEFMQMVAVARQRIVAEVKELEEVFS